MTKLFDIQSKNEHYTASVFLDEDGSVFFLGDFDVDIDGSPNWKSDPDGQPDTTLHYKGKPIDSSKVPGIVLPPECIKSVKGIVMGCKAEVTYNGKTEPAVVFDGGPHYKLGEGSEALARRLGINPSPTRGGVDDPVVLYRYWPGVPTKVDGVTYDLQPS